MTSIISRRFQGTPRTSSAHWQKCTQWSLLLEAVHKNPYYYMLVNSNKHHFGFFFLYRLSTCLLAQSCPTLCDPMDYCPPNSSSHGILQARILELVAISFSKGSSGPRDQTYISCISCTQRPILHHCTTWEDQEWVSGETQDDVNPGLYGAPSPRWCLITLYQSGEGTQSHPFGFKSQSHHPVAGTLSNTLKLYHTWSTHTQNARRGGHREFRIQ